MRQSRKPVEAAMGLWVPSERTFVGTKKIAIKNEGISVESLAQDYPGISLV